MVVSITDGKLLLEDLAKLRQQIAEVRPEKCCEETIMVESGKGASPACSNDCKWQAIDLTLATAMVYAELVVYNP